MQLEFYETFVVASLALLLGRKLADWVPPFKVYSIPEPVLGGLAIAFAMLAAHALFDLNVRFDTSRQEQFMFMFFASIGLNADLASLRKGGRMVARFLAVVLGLLVIQDLVGVSVASALGLSPAMGLLAGSVTLSGGHGTGAAWGAVFAERFGLTSATEVALACATFGLVLGGLIGGPVGRYLMGRVPKHTVLPLEGTPSTFEQPSVIREVTAPDFIETLALFTVCIVGGTALHRAFQGSAIELPAFVWVLLVGVVLRNALAALGWYHVFDRAISLLGNVSLALFLIMAMMSLRLWELASLAVPMFVLLAAQTATMALYAIFVTFRVMGANHDAAVLAAGHCGFGLGATPTAIANMQAVTDRFGPSPIAFIVVPVVGAFFIDIANALVIKLFLALPIYGH
jgi:ESS family glutamate:Na+ symporter